MTQAPPLSTVVAETGKCKLPRRVSSRDVVTDAVSQTSVGIYNVSKSRLMILTRVYTEPWPCCPNSFTGNSEAHAGELNHFQRSEWGFVTVSMVSSTREKKAKALVGVGWGGLKHFSFTTPTPTPQRTENKHQKNQKI